MTSKKTKGSDYLRIHQHRICFITAKRGSQISCLVSVISRARWATENMHILFKSLIFKKLCVFWPFFAVYIFLEDISVKVVRINYPCPLRNLKTQFYLMLETQRHIVPFFVFPFTRQYRLQHLFSHIFTSPLRQCYIQHIIMDESTFYITVGNYSFGYNYF